MDFTFLNELTNFDEKSTNEFAQPSTSRAMVQQQNVWIPSSILYQTISTSVVDRISNVSPMQTDELLMSILSDYDPTDNFPDIQ